MRVDLLYFRRFDVLESFEISSSSRIEDVLFVKRQLLCVYSTLSFATLRFLQKSNEGKINLLAGIIIIIVIVVNNNAYYHAHLI